MVTEGAAELATSSATPNRCVNIPVKQNTSCQGPDVYALSLGFYCALVLV